MFHSARAGGARSGLTLVATTSLALILVAPTAVSEAETSASDDAPGVVLLVNKSVPGFGPALPVDPISPTGSEGNIAVISTLGVAEPEAEAAEHEGEVGAGSAVLPIDPPLAERLTAEGHTVTLVDLGIALPAAPATLATIPAEVLSLPGDAADGDGGGASMTRMSTVVTIPLSGSYSFAIEGGGDARLTVDGIDVSPGFAPAAISAAVEVMGAATTALLVIDGALPVDHTQLIAAITDVQPRTIVVLDARSDPRLVDWVDAPAAILHVPPESTDALSVIDGTAQPSSTLDAPILRPAEEPGDVDGDGAVVEQELIFAEGHGLFYPDDAETESGVPAEEPNEAPEESPGEQQEPAEETTAAAHRARRPRAARAGARALAGLAAETPRGGARTCPCVGRPSRSIRFCAACTVS
ncbi:hypothetical protein FB562_1410 [Homoserinimonas aerilata]|uniref:PA14 domain-containing protein n=1 Tax=Homoserinimonas aerilata TaxID=1162970 RepID=A0A542YJS2_9MICO|nr:hypothetical protein [Homoserinimonas aerilata]TQL48319.1 hypothetical protein FB562_1410 [Homoserinimonas aerilata]